MKCTLLFICAAAVAGVKLGGNPTSPRATKTDEVSEQKQVPLWQSATAPLGFSAVVGGGAALLAAPQGRRAVKGLFRRVAGLFGDGVDDDMFAAETGDDVPEEAAEGAAENKAGGVGVPLVLSPEKLAVISERSVLLEPLAEQLQAVPVFMVTLENSTTPLSVKAGDGRLAYFFLEFVDADLFRRKLMEQRNGELSAQVAALSLADVARAYSSPAASEAKENFVVIPTMKAVLAARNLLKAKGEDETKWEERLSAASGLVPVFWFQALASQSAAGKQRKIIFFRPEDAINMWANVSASQSEEMPQEPPELLVADLQTLAGHLAKANKTDDVIFAPSSSALRIFAQPRGAPGASAAESAGADDASAASSSEVGDDADMGSFEEDVPDDDTDSDDT